MASRPRALIHEHPRFEKTPIIFVTGVHVTELDRLKGYKLGAVDYVYVPVVPEILRSKVAVLVELYLQAARAAAAQSQPRRSERRLEREHDAAGRKDARARGSTRRCSRRTPSSSTRIAAAERDAERARAETR